MTTDIDTTLTLSPATRVDCHWAELDANAINFHLPEPHGYFSIAVCLFLEADEQLGAPLEMPAEAAVDEADAVAAAIAFFASGSMPGAIARLEI